MGPLNWEAFTGDSLGDSPAARGDAAALIPREQWREMWSDDGYTGSITDYFRYNSAGVLTHYGRWNGRGIDWRRVAPDFVPPTAIASGPPAPAAIYGPPAPYAPPPPADAAETIRDPFNLAAGAADADPYAGMYAPQPVPDPFGSEGTDGFAPEQPAQLPPPPPAPPRMTGLPADESSARSVPARMRPPGASASRRPRF